MNEKKMKKTVSIGYAIRLMAWALLLLLAAVHLSLGVAEEQEEAVAQKKEALILTIEGAIGPATMDYVVRGLERAAAEQSALVIIRMDTPGGLMASMRTIIQEILLSPVPVVSYVSPSGARAASAGTYILYGSHVAAMAPATHLGSATPVSMGGLPGSREEEGGPGQEQEDSSDGASGDEDSEPATEQPTSRQQSGSAMERKIMEDAVAYIRELAERHGRNADWAEKAVREAVNLGASEALAENVIDVVAADMNDLLTQIDGRSVVMNSGSKTLDTDGLQLIRQDPDWRTKLLSIITDPNVAYFLMIIGFYGLIFELANPGALFPGVIGGICLILALFAFQVLSVNYAGLALILLGLAFIVAEAFIPSFGVLGIGGIASFVVGSIILMDGSYLTVSIPLIGGTALVAAGFLLWAVTRFISLRRRKAVSGLDNMTGETATALENFSEKRGRYQGRVWLSGERWNAVSEQPVEKDQNVRVVDVQGLTVRVAVDESQY